MDRLIIIAGGDDARSGAGIFRDAGNAILLVPASAEAVVLAVDGAATHEALCELPVGLYGVGHGSRAVLEAAGARPWGVGAVVAMSRIYEPDVLSRVRVPTLLLTVDALRPLCQLVHEYCEQQDAQNDLEAAHFACTWFTRHVGAAQREPCLRVGAGADW